jgi:hypothetical protein
MAEDEHTPFKGSLWTWTPFELPGYSNVYVSDCGEFRVLKPDGTHFDVMITLEPQTPGRL